MELSVLLVIAIEKGSVGKRTGNCDNEEETGII